MFINEPIEKLPKTSIHTIRRLKSINILTYWHLLNYFPFRFENYSLISKIGQLQAGELVTIKGRILESKNEFTRRGLKIEKITLADETGKIKIVWFNQPYLIKLFKKDLYLAVSGEVKKFLYEATIEPKQYELLENLDAPCLHTGKIIPIYPEKKGLSSRVLREKIAFIINMCKAGTEQNIQEFLPKEVIQYNGLINENKAYFNIHSPENPELCKKAGERLGFDELFVIQLVSALIKQEWKKEVVGNRFRIETIHELPLQQFINNLPFKLTNAQQRVVKEILDDLAKSTPMNRFLQGEVGSGKTVVAAIASYFAKLNNYQTLLMAPTEILAEQHFQTISRLFKNYPVKIGIQTGSKKINKVNDYDVIIGTHAIYNKKINFNRVGLVIVDEQHRFGVVQRSLLKKKGVNPHLLTMTATPIPRTVSLTLYGELDLSVIDEMPKGRLAVRTYLVPNNKREKSYQWIKNQIKSHCVQIFVICPLIEESEAETMKSVKAVKKEYEFLKNNVFDGYKVGLLHGKMKAQEKDLVMNNFKQKKYDLLVATSVVEVGIDIANAAIILIEGADRYGLAQLHQLRGRVGRGDKQSYCLLFTDNEDNLERLKFFSKKNNGMDLAEYDLRMRGPGQVFGTKQHGCSDLKIASFGDYPLIKKTKSAAHYFLNKYKIEDFEELKKRVDEYKVSLISRD